MTKGKIDPQRGEIWLVDFDPVVGQEIGKNNRPAVVIGDPALGRTGLRIIVPVTDDKKRNEKLSWFVELNATKHNGLSKDSEADCSQIKSLSVNRFTGKIGNVTSNQLDDIVDAVALCIGY